MSQYAPISSLYTSEQCPRCGYTFSIGFDNSNIVKCPSCRTNYEKTKNAPCTTCRTDYPGDNNGYYKQGCPALMSDGRFLTNYRSSNELTDQMMKLNGIKSSNEFRNFLQNNANKFINSEREYLLNQNTCDPKTGCSQGWYDLWNVNGGDWSNMDNIPVSRNYRSS